MVRRDGVKIARRCWLPEQHADDFSARCAVAVATSAAGTVLSSITAARLHGLWLPSLPETIHLAAAQSGRRASGMTRTQRREFRSHRRSFVDDDRCIVDGLPVTSLARTWVDLAAELAVPDLVAAGDSALRSGATHDELAAAVARSVHLRGVRRAREALSLLDARSRSRPESHLRVAMCAPGLPRFAVNEPIYRNTGGWLAEPDLSLAEARLALEYQGETHAELRQMRRDITRAADLRSEGWLCLYFGPAEVFGRPWLITAEVRGLIRNRIRKSSGDIGPEWSGLADHSDPN